jgi:hypothetical protein
VRRIKTILRRAAMKRKGIVTLLVLVCFLAMGMFGAFAAERDHLSLRGIKGVRVMVEANPEQGGSTKGQLQTDIEFRLRNAGIRVFTREESLKAKGSPFLYVNITIMPVSGLSLYVFSILVELYQDVRLERDPSIVVMGASTWSKHYLGAVGKNNLGQIRNRADDLVDMFINDYLSVNPVTPAK